MDAFSKPGEERPPNVTEIDVRGNALADTFAGEVAENYAVSNEVAEDCIRHYKNVKLIQNRLVAIISSLPPRQRFQTVATPKEAKQSLNDLISVSAHKLVQEGHRFTCVH